MSWIWEPNDNVIIHIVIWARNYAIERRLLQLEAGRNRFAGRFGVVSGVFGVAFLVRVRDARLVVGKNRLSSIVNC